MRNANSTPDARHPRSVISLPILMILTVLLFFPSTRADAQSHYKDLTFPPLRDITVPQVDRSALGNGLMLYLIEDHSLPKVQGVAFIKTGSRFESSDKVGMASIVGQVMRTGGTTNRKGEEIDRLLENMGAVVETGIGTSSASASLFCLKENLPLVLEVMADLLRNPAFPEDKIELAKVQQRASISRRNDNVMGIASREFMKLLYGPTNPYARSTEYATIDRITREDLVRFHGRYFHPNQTALGLWGDFDSREVKNLIERHFGSWERSEHEIPP